MERTDVRCIGNPQALREDRVMAGCGLCLFWNFQVNYFSKGHSAFIFRPTLAWHTSSWDMVGDPLWREEMSLGDFPLVQVWEWGRERDGSVPPPQLGECLRMWRAYLLTGRCMIAGLPTVSSLRGEGRIWSPPETLVHEQTIEDLRDEFPGQIKNPVAPPFLSGTKHPIYSLMQSGTESLLVSILHNSFRGAFASWDIPRGLR